MSLERTDLREIATIASAEAAHCRHDVALPEHLLTSLLIWDERVSGPYRDAAGVRARDVRRVLRKRIPASRRRSSTLVDLGDDARRLVASADTAEELLGALLEIESVCDLLVEAGGDPSAMTVVSTEEYPACPSCGYSISEGIATRLVRVPVGRDTRVLVAWSCARCGSVLGISPPEERRRGIL